MRDKTGKRRQVTRTSPLKLDARGRQVPDAQGSRATDAALAAATATRVDAGGELSESTTVRQLWDEYQGYLVEQNRAPSTIESYDVIAVTFNTAFGGRLLLEVSTSSVEAFLVDLGRAKGPGSMRTGRNVLSGMFRYAVREDAPTVNRVRETSSCRTSRPRAGRAAHEMSPSKSCA
ncbi:hypothetical protein [Nocardia farcinica]|uniref:hypothetical protein n=1 Tax=Nocardia farcinica TaxID=37329 RepID=UPI0018933E01|nr:hypothetical protein [Nocardia farcinica]MBF6070152.1 hypothetical protein [Nocardia farcinica]MBF6294382.1 hypothetical protein [Nocardia farcinica]MBF6381110.1 hypothetical protein [Nocardia farcinica]MBF6443690.1 hypothetical protein [Nocardia farcinica]MBF6522118.1 hypothetical protein [Nocardia farcinica]